MIVLQSTDNDIKSRVTELALGRGLSIRDFDQDSVPNVGIAPDVLLLISDTVEVAPPTSEFVKFLKGNSFKKALVIIPNSHSFRVESHMNGAIKFLELPLFGNLTSELSTFYLSYALEFLDHDQPNLPTGDPKSYSLVRLIQKISKSNVTLLVNGPTGTGKEVVSHLIHDMSDRDDEAFVAINCAAIPEQMLEATLFGHEKGAFTGALQSSQGLIRAANKGTILLDEVSEMPLALQAKLLRVLQEKKVLPVGGTTELPVDVRIIATTNRDIAAEIKKGTFREDLYYRLNVFPLITLPLRERAGDIAPIVAHMLFKLDLKEAAKVTISAEAFVALTKYSWPGNVRELYNVIQRARLLCSNNEILATDLIFDSPGFGSEVNTADMLAARFATDFEQEIS